MAYTPSMTNLIQELARLPGVAAVGATSHMPLSDWANWSGVAAPVTVPPEEHDRYYRDHRAVTPGFFRAMGVELVSGIGGVVLAVQRVGEGLQARLAPPTPRVRRAGS